MCKRTKYRPKKMHFPTRKVHFYLRISKKSVLLQPKTFGKM